MSDEQKSAELTWVKLYRTDIEPCVVGLDDKSLGAAFRCFYIYAWLNPEDLPNPIPPEIYMGFSILKRSIDASKAKYAKRCKVNAENGKKGGKAKAANEEARTKAATNSVKPPTKRRFKEFAQECLDFGDISCRMKDIDDYYDYLKNNNWSIDGRPLKHDKYQWQDFILIAFGTKIDYPKGNEIAYAVLEELFLQTGETCFPNEYQVEDFVKDCYSPSFKLFDVGGENFTEDQLSEAVARAIAIHGE